MLKAISTFVFVSSRLHPGMLDKLVQDGAQAIELFSARQHFDYTDRQQVREIGNWFKHSGVPLHSIHAPLYSDDDWGRTGTPPVNLIDSKKSNRVNSLDEVKRSLEIAETVPCRYLVQHLGMPGEAHDNSKFEFALSSIEHLHAFAKPLGVMVLLENIPNEVTTGARLNAMIETLHLPDLGACFDLGHAHITSTVEEVFTTLKTHIRSTHVHDNNRDKDNHLFPGEGNIDWKQAIALLREAPHVPPLLMEIEAAQRNDVHQKFVETFRMLDGTSQSSSAG